MNTWGRKRGPIRIEAGRRMHSREQPSGRRDQGGTTGGQNVSGDYHDTTDTTEALVKQKETYLRFGPTCGKAEGVIEVHLDMAPSRCPAA